ncbi:MAG: glycosyltransferase involved in cell wall biosynthesis [Planctomycetota bacterium]|jgi:glycosyltransferase involved in cell wall biosynthesis
MKIKLLLVAHHLNPDWGSEPLIGWRWATHLQDLVDLHIVTHIRNQPFIESRPPLNAEIHYVDTEKMAARINRINNMLWKKTAVVAKSLLESFALRAFDRAATKIAKKLVQDHKIELIHRVSPISPRIGTTLYRAGLPIVIGPLNGGMQMPEGFDDVSNRESNKALALRKFAKLIAPFERNVSQADAILVATESTRRVLDQSVQDEAALICENAVIPEMFEPKYDRQGRGLRLLYLGRLLPYKGVQFAIGALAQLTDLEGITLTIVGDGPERPRLERLAIEQGVADKVKFLGQVPIEEVPKHMNQCDVFLLPSLRESGGSVILEAMAAGKPVVVFDHGGPGETVNKKVGIKISATSSQELEAKMSGAIRDLYQNENLREKLAHGARQHIEDNFTWTGKIDEVVAIYEELINAPKNIVAA